ncbi:unnamed protein product [Jaminaea pallidilutea]
MGDAVEDRRNYSFQASSGDMPAAYNSESRPPLDVAFDMLPLSDDEGDFLSRQRAVGSSDADLLLLSDEEEVDLGAQASNADGDLLPGELPLPPSNQEALCQRKEEALLPQHEEVTVVAENGNVSRTISIDFAGASCKFPSRAPKNTRRLAQLFRLLEEISFALSTGQQVTKRDLYYKAPQLFRRQVVVDHLLDKVVRGMGVSRSATGIVASVKGLFAVGRGCNMTFRKLLREQYGEGSDHPLSGAEEVCCAIEAHSVTLVPSIDHLLHIDTIAKWVLIVEKEAVFKTIVDSKFLGDNRDVLTIGKSLGARFSSLGPGVIVTGKGYPDLATKDFLARLADEHPHLRFFALVDGDPFGLDIFNHFALCLQDKDATTLQQERTWLSQNSSPSCSTCSQTPHKLELLGIGKKDVAESWLDPGDALPLGSADLCKARSLLEGPCRTSNETVRHGMQHLVTAGVKYEIEAIATASRRRGFGEDGLIRYLLHRIGQKLRGATDEGLDLQIRSPVWMLP